VTQADLMIEIDKLRAQLNEANDTLEAIRTGQIDALVVNDQSGPSLFTLRSADRAYRFFIEQMSEGAVTLNRDGLIIYSNSQFSKLIQQPLSRVTGNLFSDFVCAEDLPLFEKAFSRGWTLNVKSEMRLHAGEAPVTVQLSLNVLELDDDTALSVIITDLTLQKKIEKQLTENNEQLRKLNEALVSSNDDLQQFASVASHDLQEPLRKIQIFSTFLKDRSYHELSEISRGYVEKIFSSSQRMKVLIVDILTYSKLSADGFLSEMVDLNEVVQEILEDFDLRISEKNARVEVSALCTVEGNKGQLRQVFYNLISNALKFVSSGRAPVISIRLEKADAAELGMSLKDAGNFCRIVVTDNGIGFEDGYASVIFGLFEKLNPKNTYEGSGIGLAIAKKIVEKHHGMILAKGKVDEGSEFNVFLPFKQPASK